MYDHYVVLGSKIKVDAWTEENATTYGAMVGIKVDDNNSISSDLINVLEHGRGFTTYKKLRQMADGEHSMTTVYSKFSAKRFFGIKDAKDVDSISAVVTTNPSDLAYYNVWWGHPDGSTVLEDLNVVVTIDYIVVFSEPKDQPSS